jgi:ABC-type phosphate/phosphonate transport system permease subunit
LKVDLKALLFSRPILPGHTAGILAGSYYTRGDKLMGF